MVYGLSTYHYPGKYITTYQIGNKKNNKYITYHMEIIVFGKRQSSIPGPTLLNNFMRDLLTVLSDIEFESYAYDNMLLLHYYAVYY